MSNVKSKFTSFLFCVICLMINIRSQIKTEKKYFDFFNCEDALLLKNQTGSNLEIQKIEKINQIFDYKQLIDKLTFMFRTNTTQDLPSSNAMKTASFIKYKNFTTEKNFQLTFKIRKNPYIFDIQNSSDYIDSVKNNALYVWIMRNNKYSFENIRKNAEFNGIALKITKTEIRLIISKTTGIMINKPYFDINDDYTKLVEEKVIPSNFREEIIKITAIKNFIFIERFNQTNNNWDLLYLDKLKFITVENCGINVEFISLLKNVREYFALDEFLICPIKNFIYNITNESTLKYLDDYDKKNENKSIIDKSDQLASKYKKEEYKSEMIIDKIKDTEELLDFILNKTNQIKTNLVENSNFNDFSMINKSLYPKRSENIETSNNQSNFDILYEELKMILNKKKNKEESNKTHVESSVQNLNEEFKNAIRTIQSLEDIIKNESKIIAIKHKNYPNFEENFNQMKSNFFRLEKNLKIIINECEGDIKNILTILFENNTSVVFSIIDHMIIMIVISVIILLILINKYINVICEKTNNSLKISRELNNVEKCID